MERICFSENQNSFESINDFGVDKVIDDTITNINDLIDTRVNTSKREIILKLQKEIDQLIEYGKKIISENGEYENINYLIEKILLSVDYIFKKLHINRVFNIRPDIEIDNFSNNNISRKIFGFVIPRNTDISSMSAVKGGNCYMMGVLFYYNLFTEIFGDLKLNFQFLIEKNNKHGLLIINDIFCVDTRNSGTNFDKANSKYEMQYITKNKGKFIEFKDVNDFLEEINFIKKLNELEIMVGGESKLRLNIKSEKDNIIISISENGGFIYKSFTKGYLINLSLEDKIESIVNGLGLSDNDQKRFITIFSKFNKKEFENLFN